MSRLEELIATLCPDGVEYKEIQELFTLKNGYTPAKSNQSNYKDGIIPWFRMEDIRENGGILSDSLQKISQTAVKGKLFPADSIIVATSATIGVHALITVDFLCNQRFTCLTTKEKYKEKLHPKFIYYICFSLDKWCLENSNISSFASVDMTRFRKYKIPVPPLPVQEEIVRILDKFTELTENLIAELKKRKQQYQHYRIALLSFNNNIIIKKLKHICSITIGEFIHKNKQKENGKYPVFNGGISNTGYYDSFNNSGNKIIISARGANAGFVNRISGKYWAGNSCYSIGVIDKNINWNFLYYYLKNLQNKLIGEQQKGSIPAISKKQMEEFSIPVPPLEEQERIVAILDRFDALCNDPISGLPAEIEARKKQYEYYRDKLLTFKEKEAD